MKIIHLSLLMLMLAGCIGVTSVETAPTEPAAMAVLPPTPIPATTVATATEVPEITETAPPVEESAAETPSPEAVAEPMDWSQNAFVEGDFYIRGNPAAPIRLVDYSDFL
jgi:hypothetical protein